MSQGHVNYSSVMRASYIVSVKVKVTEVVDIVAEIHRVVTWNHENYSNTLARK